MQREFDYQLTLRLRRHGVFFGPGVVEVLQLVGQYGSLNAAAQKMGMSYSKAWRIIHHAEKQWAIPLITSNVGGANGGGTELAPTAKLLIQRYLAFEAAAQQQVDQLFSHYFADIKIGMSEGQMHEK